MSKQQYLYPLHLDTSTAGNKLTLPSGLRGLRLETLPPGAVLGLVAEAAAEPVRLLLPGSTYHFEEEGSAPTSITVLTAVQGVAYFTGWAKGVVLLGGSAQPLRFGTSVVLTADDPAPYNGGANDTTGDLVLGVCPPDRTWQILGASASIKTTAAVGARAPTFRIFARAGQPIIDGLSGAVAASKTLPLVLYANAADIDGFQFFAYPLEVPSGGRIVMGIGGLDGTSPPLAGDQLSRAYLHVRENIET